MPHNLIQKKGESTWYVRLAIPVDVQKALGCKVRIQSLKTGLRKEAMEARLPILAQWKAEIAAARVQIQNRKENWRVEVAVMGSAMEKLTHKMLHKFMKGPSTDLPSAVSNFNEKLARGLADTARKASERYDLTAAEIAEANELLRAPAAYLGTIKTEAVVAITSARLKRFREFRESRGGADKHVDQQLSRLELLSGFLKKEALPLNFDSVDLWLKSLNRAPATLNQYLMSGTAFWKWAIKYDEDWREEYKDKVNPFTGHDLPQGGGSETAGQDREMYTPDDAIKLHQAALQKKDQPLADLILLGWYTGGRIEELCKLTKDSVITADGIQCFDFPKSKSKASKRVVPIHPSLLPTVNRLIKDSADNFLIPVSSNGPYNKRSHAISKAFGRLRDKAGFSRLHVFHSFRHTAVTQLIRADVPEHLAQELIGHETGSVTHDVYSKGASTEQKLAAISKLPSLPDIRI